jgi:F-type H+-transporting ATPase subunit delta
MTQVTITSAVELSKAQLDKITTALTKKYGAKLDVVQVINEGLLGGLQIAVNSKQIDGSLKTRLDQIKKLLVTEN